MTELLTRQESTMHLTVGGIQREALVFGPTPAPTALKLPVVFAFHGHGETMTDAATLMHLEAGWPESVVVYPQGLTGRPSPVDLCGTRPGWQVQANQCGGVGNQDIDFFDAMMAEVELSYSVDTKRVYVTGFSNGAVFSYLLWAKRAHTLAAIAECAGRLWQSEHLAVPRPLLAIAGTADKTDPFCVQQATIEDARLVNSATGPGQPCGPFCTVYPSTTLTPVKTYIHPGGHVYPSWASQETVKFFKAHSLP
jgi:polyhydroxybutyrate depolymerase